MKRLCITTYGIIMIILPIILLILLNQDDVIMWDLPRIVLIGMITIVAEIVGIGMLWIEYYVDKRDKLGEFNIH